MKVYYHRDADGKCAAHQVYEAIEGGEYISIDYNESVDIAKVKKDEWVWILDFSIPVEDMRELLKITKNVVWIDHHKTSIEKYDGCDLEIKGIRHVGISGCELTWSWIDFGPSAVSAEQIIDNVENAPHYVRLVGDHDVWQYKFGDSARYFQQTFKLNGSPEPGDDFWVEASENISKILADGVTCLKYSEAIDRTAVEDWAYEVSFEGNAGLVLNSSNFTSDTFGARFDDYSLVAIYEHNGDEFKVSLYSTSIDVSVIARKYGGGGHEKAAGFFCKELPWVKK